MNNHRSIGVYAFRTTANDHLNYASRFRTLNNQGRTCDIVAMMRTGDTIATAGGCSYDEEHYMEWAPKIYGQKITARWEENFWLDETITVWSNSAWDKLKKHFDLLKSDYSLFREEFVPMRWTANGVTMFDLRGCCERLTHYLLGIKVRNVAMEERNDGTIVLYGRKTWLTTFREGIAMINYYTMASKFKEVYGF